MKNEEQFENTIRIALKKEVQSFDASPDALKRIKERIQGNCLAKTGFQQRLANYTFALQFHKTAAALSCILICAALILACSKPARVWAEEGIKKVIAMIYVVVKNEDGGYDMKQVSMDLSQIYLTTGESTYLEDDELAKEVGFNTKTPEELNGAYILWNTGICSTEDSPQKWVFKHYLNGSKYLILEIAANETSFQVNRTSYIECREEFKVQNVLVKHLELHSPVYPKEGSPSIFVPSIKPIGIKITHRMDWEWNGVHYRLSGYEAPLREFKDVTSALVKELQQK